MGKTHRALKRAEDQYREHQTRISQEVFTKELEKVPRRPSARKNMKYYDDLKKKLLIRNIGGSIKTVLFVKTFTERESKDHAIKFATLLAEDLRLKVLFIDLYQWTQDLQEVFEIDYALFMSDLFSNCGRMKHSIKKIGPGNLYRTRWGGNHSRLVDSFQSGEFDQFIKNVYEKFDYLILNIPESAGFQECRVLCSKVDAVVLILKSDKIANRIALNGKGDLQNFSDKLLGVIVGNTRTYRYKFLKTAGGVMVGCLIFTAGFLIGNSKLIPRVTSALSNYIGVVPDINEDKPIRTEKVIDLAQLNHSDIRMPATEQIHEFSKTKPPSNNIQQEKSVKTSEAATSAESSFKSGQTRVNDHKRNNNSESNKVDQTMRDAKNTAGLTVEKEKEKPILSRDNDPGGKRKAESKKGHVVVVKKGDTLFRIIYRNYGTYNAKIANFVLKENPKVINSTHIVVGQKIKLPEID